MLVLGPAEEFGWRGFALPLLQRRMAPVRAGLVLGLIWGVWHLPAFYLSGLVQSEWSFMPFLIGSVAVSLILTAMFNAARGLHPARRAVPLPAQQSPLAGRAALGYVSLRRRRRGCRVDRPQADVQPRRSGDRCDSRKRQTVAVDQGASRRIKQATLRRVPPVAVASR
ncbi:CPBP family intramembrane glutamic endopeptidase [Mesorhizobium sp.]|uniref:CPBP family intramembrane glutamic endopeptidase n=1 Tax=Mesorhizobium sp. TaxID=1871066 RepID=UPI00345B9AEE